MQPARGAPIARGWLARWRLAGAKQPTKQPLHSWAVYNIKGTPAKLVGIVYDVYDPPDADAAIKRPTNRAAAD
jgi:hypothetical protein